MAPPRIRKKADERDMRQNVGLFLSKSVMGVNKRRVENTGRGMGKAGQMKGTTIAPPMERKKADKWAMKQSMDLFLSVSKRGECHAHVPLLLLLTKHA